MITKNKISNFILIKLFNIASILDSKGLHKEANIIDLLLKQAVDINQYWDKPEDKQPVMDVPESGMTPEQYQRYYGKPMEPERAKELEEKVAPQKKQLGTEIKGGKKSLIDYLVGLKRLIKSYNVHIVDSDIKDINLSVGLLFDNFVALRDFMYEARMIVPHKTSDDTLVGEFAHILGDGILALKPETYEDIRITLLFTPSNWNKRDYDAKQEFAALVMHLLSET